MRYNNYFSIRSILILVTVVFFSACGGGGSSFSTDEATSSSGSTSSSSSSSSSSTSSGSSSSSSSSSDTSCSNTLDTCPAYESIPSGSTISTLTGTPSISTQQVVKANGSTENQACVLSGTGTACIN